MTSIAATTPNPLLIPVFALTVRMYAHRHHIPSALFALSLTGSLAMHSFTSPWMWVSWLALGFGAILSLIDQPFRKGPWPVFYGLIGLLVLVFAAIPGSLLWGSGNWILSTGVALWMAPSILFYLTSNGSRVFSWLVPVWLFQAGLVLYQGFTRWALADNGMIYIRNPYPVGFTLNCNLTAGFLCLGIIYLLTTRYKVLSLPLILAMLMTGSRWAAMVCFAVILLMAVTRRLSLKALVGGCLAMLVAVGGILAISPTSMIGVAGFDSLTAVLDPFTNGQISGRLAVPHIPSLLPTGIAEHPGLHNVPLRIAVENGILAALMWVGVTAYALLGAHVAKIPCGPAASAKDSGVMDADNALRGSQRHFSAAWWMLLALGMLSLLDYYTWMGHLGGFWWLLVGMRVK